MKKLSLLIFIFLITGHSFGQKVTQMSRVKISPNGHFLQYDNGKPFFWLGDTGWLMFSRLTNDEIDTYLDNRSKKGFNVIQAVILDDNTMPIGPNRNGDMVVTDLDPSRPNEKYFKVIDRAIQQAAKKKLYMGLLPTWGSNVGNMRPGAPVLFNVQNAYQYGLFLGKRYRDYTNIIWIIGGDTPPQREGADWKPVWRSMAKGIREGTGNKVLISYHPPGEASSTDYWRGDNTIDINMIQSGHRIHDFHNWDWILRDYNLPPTKPVLDGEPNYEDHPVNWQNNTGYFRDYDVRKQLYRSVFSGACGVTYGHQAVWQFYNGKGKSFAYPDRFWTEALDRPGAFQAGYLKNLILSRPSLNRVPDQSIIKSAQGQKGEYITAFRDSDGSYAMIYLPVGKTIEINVAALKAKTLSSYWFDPQVGKAMKISTQLNDGKSLSFTPPTTGLGNDWVLIIDDAQKKYKPDF
jgi:hypothetical protein